MKDVKEIVAVGNFCPQDTGVRQLNLRNMPIDYNITSGISSYDQNMFGSCLWPICLTD